ncbi:MAG: Gfo/Idh/MocA family oxidoreductase [Planctomycetales bacterium]|nr:Gfo/Idh/MocA family oxidoreductase [Planctomycetales bacterium]
MDRRRFLGHSGSLAGAALAVGGVMTETARQARAAANDRVVVCVAGVRGRGGSLLSTFAAQPDVEVKYVCDLDAGVLQSRAGQVKDIRGRAPQTITDYRQALEDDSVDALVLGTPDHWHALPSIHACQAGKDVYVEKPDGHNILEGRTMVAAAKKHGRIIQLGTQARSGSLQAAAMKYLAAGNLGRVRFAKAWESSRQGSIGHPADSEPPAGFDYNTWLGPAPLRPFNVRRWHGSWRWFYDYGTGDLGNDGVHRLDVARWALATAVAAQGEKLPLIPRKIAALGGKYYFDDDQEFPDTLMVTYDYPGYLLTYEMRIWTAYHLHDEPEGSAVYGDQGSVVIGNGRWRAFDPKGKLISEERGSDNTTGHVRNFLECMASRERPNADLETVGHPSSLLCHLGNVAWRVGRTVEFDAASYSFGNDAAANALLSRTEYRSPWTLPKLDEV